MKAVAGLLAVLLMLSCASLAQTTPAQQTAAGGESSRPEAAGQEAAGQTSTPSASPAVSAPSTEVAAASAGAVPAVAATPLAPGAKIFLEPMNGFEQLLADAIHEKKVPVVLVNDRADADFVMSGEARVKNPNILTGMVLSKRGGANIAMKDARTGNLVFACNFHRVDGGERDGDIYIGWAGQCAGHLKKALKKATEKK